MNVNTTQFFFSGLILWDSIEPSEEWVENYVPASVKPYCFVKPTQDHIDYEAMKLLLLFIYYTFVSICFCSSN